MQVDISIIIAIFGGIGLMGIGFIIGRLSKQENYLVSEDKLREIEKKRDAIINYKGHVPVKVNGTNTGPLSRDSWNDSAFAEPGIVYRPSAEELEKMHEPQKVREAKEAVAETIRNTPLPEEI